MTLRDFSIAGPLQNSARYLGFLRCGVRLQVQNVGFAAADPANAPDPDIGQYIFDIAECGRLTLRDCRFQGALRFSVGQDNLIENVAAGSIANEEYSIDYDYVNTTSTGAAGWVSNLPECERINLTDCVIRNYGYMSGPYGATSIAFAKGSRVTNLTIADRRISEEPSFIIFINADGLTLTNVVSDTSISFQGNNLKLTNVACPPPMVFTGDNLRLMNVLSDRVTLTSSGGGTLLAPLAAGTLDDGSGNLDQPLAVRSNGVVRVPTFVYQSATGPDLVVQAAASDRPGLQVRGQSLQTEALMQWQDATGSPLFAILADGSLATIKSAPSGTKGEIVRKLEIFDIDGTPLGYLPIYDSL